MPMQPLSRYIVLYLWMALLIGCSSHGGHSAGMHPADVLNRKARTWQYRDLDSASHYAHMAYDEAGHYLHGRSVACNMLGFVSAMQLKFDEALYWYDQVEHQSGCELERFIADVGRMNIYQRTADNLAFYDCRARATKRLAHIGEESATFSPAEQHRLQSAMNDFHMVSALHHYMIGQRPEAYAEMRQVVDNDVLRADSAQWLMYVYLKGIGLDVEGDTREQRQLRRYAYLNTCLRTSQTRGYRYFEGLASSGLSELLSDSLRMARIAQQRPGTLAQLVSGADTSAGLSMSLAQSALQSLTAYGDRYGMLNAAIRIASLYNRVGEYETALALLDSLDTMIIPDAQARQHEEMSVAYAGLGDKLMSDDHRNQYLDLLETTRQDKEVESRYISLQRRSRTMKLLLYVVVVGIVVLAILLTLLARRRHRRGNGYVQRLRGLLNETEKRVYLRQRAIEKGKRDNMVRKASFSMVTGMMPYIDRMAHEVDLLQSPAVWEDKELRARKLTYIAELADELNAQNELLARWIRTTQGMVRLTIESFPLSEVLYMLECSSSSFAMRGITLEVQSCDVVVKADKALTFFMLNTLADNARKFTPEGGRVSISAEVHDGYVELSVSDTGVGMSSEDIARILQEKVYDASAIGQGMSVDWRNKKGSGFGLLNCKGIIDKYRKTDPLFEVCSLGISSKVGEGSRFWFRLPKGVRRMLLLVIGFFPLAIGSPLIAQGSPSTVADIELNTLHPALIRASIYADSVYYANVDGRYHEALIYADSALQCLNAHHRQCATEYIDTLSVTRGESDVEIRWWLSDYATDYHIILDVRNELAVANLALHRLPEYRYNNRIYNDLYKLVTEDRSLIDYCNRMQRYYSNMSVAVLICLLLVVGYLVIIVYVFMNRVASTYRNIESVEEDERRARHEENRLHVQNMVLDNSLSTLKHETIYYPNRIKQLVGSLDSIDERRQMQELITYYRLVFSTLAGCASRQLEEVTFRRSSVEVDALFHRAAEYHAKLYGGTKGTNLTLSSCDGVLLCDEMLVDFLIEQLIDGALSLSATDTLHLMAEQDGDFIRISLINKSRSLDAETLHTLFSPSQSRITCVDDCLQGTEYIVCRQIIREHDSHFNHIGCRIKAEPIDEGYVVWFTLPRQ